MVKQKYKYKKAYGASVAIKVPRDLYLQIKEQSLQFGLRIRLTVTAAFTEWLKRPYNEQIDILRQTPKNNNDWVILHAQIPRNVSRKFHTQLFSHGFIQRFCAIAALSEFLKLPPDTQASLLYKIPIKDDPDNTTQNKTDEDVQQLPIVG